MQFGEVFYNVSLPLTPSVNLMLVSQKVETFDAANFRSQLKVFQGKEMHWQVCDLIHRRFCRMMISGVKSEDNRKNNLQDSERGGRSDGAGADHLRQHQRRHGLVNRDQRRWASEN